MLLYKDPNRMHVQHIQSILDTDTDPESEAQIAIFLWKIVLDFFIFIDYLIYYCSSHPNSGSATYIKLVYYLD